MKSDFKINSKRTFEIVSTSENLNKNLDKVIMTLDSIVYDDYSELGYALQEVIDEVLDLKVGESIYFTPNRDIKDSKGLILRIK